MRMELQGLFACRVEKWFAYLSVADIYDFHLRRNVLMPVKKSEVGKWESFKQIHKVNICHLKGGVGVKELKVAETEMSRL